MLIVIKEHPTVLVVCTKKYPVTVTISMFPFNTYTAQQQPDDEPEVTEVTPRVKGTQQNTHMPLQTCLHQATQQLKKQW